jgi:hypothetical protein
MRFAIIVSSILFSLTALANCKVFIPEKEFNYYGYIINFDFTEMLSKKNYKEVYSAEESDLLLSLEGIEFEGRNFHRAKAILALGDYKVEESVLCLTQFCGLSDYGKAFSKSYRKLSALIPYCQ